MSIDGDGNERAIREKKTRKSSGEDEEVTLEEKGEDVWKWGIQEKKRNNEVRPRKEK